MSDAYNKAPPGFASGTKRSRHRETASSVALPSVGRAVWLFDGLISNVAGHGRGKLRFAAMLSRTRGVKLKKSRDHEAAGK